MTRLGRGNAAKEDPGEGVRLEELKKREACPLMWSSSLPGKLNSNLEHGNIGTVFWASSDLGISKNTESKRLRFSDNRTTLMYW